MANNFSNKSVMSQQDFQQTEENINRYKENITSLTQDFELGLFLYLVNKIKWKLFGILLLFTLFAMIYLRYTPEKYKTKAVIQIAIKDQPTELSDLYSFNSTTNLSSEIALINSQTSISRLAKKLKLDIFYFNEGEVLTKFLYGSTLFELENYSVKDPIINSKKIYLSHDGNYFSLTNKNADIVYADYVEPNKFFSSKYLSGIIKPSTTLESLKSSIQLSRSFFIINNSKEITKEIISGLEINTENPSAQTIGISHEHTNLKFSQDICDGLVEVYMDYELEKKQISNDNVVAFIKIQKDSIRKKLIENEKKLRRFRKKNIYTSELNVIKEKKKNIK